LEPAFTHFLLAVKLGTVLDALRLPPSTTKEEWMKLEQNDDLSCSRSFPQRKGGNIIKRKEEAINYDNKEKNLLKAER
jgi:hypothetical protein